MTNSIKKIASYVYGAGILTNALLSIHDENLKIEYAKQKHKNINITVNDYALHSFGAACAGAVSGIMWPITVIGRLSVMIVPK